jgi:hypothetical protein
MHGFFDGGTGHHSGAQKVYAWCERSGVKPGSLCIGWATRKPWCDRCAENQVFDMFPLASFQGDDGLLNGKRPPWCRTHR